MRVVLLVLATVLQACLGADGWSAEPTKFVRTEELIDRDIAAWRELFQKGDFKSLDDIADEFRVQRAKYPNGRSKLWRFTWCPFASDRSAMSDEDYTKAFEQIAAWKKDRPDSVNALLLEAHLWLEYAFCARGGEWASETPESQLKLFHERCEKASVTLDLIDTKKLPVDAAYRRLRIEIAKGIGEKPDRKLVYDELNIDPRNMDVVHGMVSCLLPRWFGEPGELEQFAEEVADRTRADCGDMQYAIVAIAAKEYLYSYLLEAHPFDWPRIHRGFLDLERLYPDSRDHWNDEAQLAFMAEDLKTVYEIMPKIDPVLNRKNWEESGIHFDKFRERITPEMLAGDQRRLFLGHTHSVMSLQTLGDNKVLVSGNRGGGVRIHDLATGARRGWAILDGIWAGTASIDTATGLLACGFESEPGFLLHDLVRGRSVALKPTKKRINRTAFSPTDRLLAVSDEAGAVLVLNLEDGETLQTWEPIGSRQVYGVAFVPGSDHLALAGSDGHCLLVNYKTGERVADRKVTATELHSLAASQDHIAVGTGKGDVYLLDSKTLEEEGSFSSPPWQIFALAFSPDGQTLAFGYRADHWEQPIENTLYVWHHTREKTPRPLAGHKYGVNRVIFAGEGKVLYSASHDWTVREWDVPKPE